MTKRAVLALAVATFVGCAGSMPADAPVVPNTAADENLRTVTIDLAEMGSAGVGFGLHPTKDPVVVSTTAPSGLVEVCPAGASGQAASDETAWPGGCRGLSSGSAQALPPTSGGEHVGLRVRVQETAADPSGLVTVQWSGADPFFAFQPGVLQPLGSRAVTLTFGSGGDLTGFVRSDGEWTLEFEHDADTVTYDGLNNAEHVLLFEGLLRGEWIVRYTNQSSHAQEPELYLDWPE